MNIILKIEGAIILLLVIFWLLGELAYMGMELDMMYYDYEYHEFLHDSMQDNEEES